MLNFNGYFMQGPLLGFPCLQTWLCPSCGQMVWDESILTIDYENTGDYEETWVSVYEEYETIQILNPILFIPDSFKCRHCGHFDFEENLILSSVVVM